jgi:hypothetical protein
VIRTIVYEVSAFERLIDPHSDLYYQWRIFTTSSHGLPEVMLTFSLYGFSPDADRLLVHESSHHLKAFDYAGSDLQGAMSADIRERIEAFKNTVQEMAERRGVAAIWGRIEGARNPLPEEEDLPARAGLIIGS